MLGLHTATVMSQGFDLGGVDWPSSLSPQHSALLGAAPAAG